MTRFSPAAEVVAALVMSAFFSLRDFVIATKYKFMLENFINLTFLDGILVKLLKKSSIFHKGT